MSLNLTVQEADVIWTEAEQHCPPVTSIDRLETIRTVPSQLGSGYAREIELCPGLELRIFNETLHENLTLRGTENLHLVQFKVLLSGVEDSGDYVLINAEQGYIGGSGIQRGLTVFAPGMQPAVGIDIHLQPHLLRQFFATLDGELPIELQPLVRGEDWQRAFSPKTTGAIRAVVQQMMDCPFLGMTRRMYLQGKVFELMALQLEGIADPRLETRLHQPEAIAESALKPSTIARIHDAAVILRSQLESPPSQIELAKQVGVGQCTLHKGFRSLFGVTPFAYLTRQRMEQAERLLREPQATVVEVANRVGYANPAQFAAAFKRQFGITPSDCIRGGRIAR
jgi:AraC-like DNA-binding protein